VPAAVVNGILGWREIGVGEGADGDADRAAILALFRMKEIGPADRAEAETEFGALIAGADVFGGAAGHLIIGAEGCEGGEDAAGAALAGEAVADADAERLALDRYLQLSAGAFGNSCPHGAKLPPGISAPKAGADDGEVKLAACISHGVFIRRKLRGVASVSLS